MAEHASTTNGYIEELSSEEGKAMFERQAQKYLGVDGETFLQKLEAGEYGDPDDDPNVMRLVMLIPFAQ